MRFRLVWSRAVTFPTDMVRMASQVRIGFQSACRSGSAERTIRNRAAKPAAFAPTDMKPVTVVGAPSYASGVHMWKGTAATLKAKPTSSSSDPISSIGLPIIGEPARNTAMRLRLVVPVAP